MGRVRVLYCTYANQREGIPNYHCMTMRVSADCIWRRGDVGVEAYRLNM
jgi:hypothetical protein